MSFRAFSSRFDGLAELAGIYPYDRELIEGDGVVDIVVSNKAGDGFKARFHADGRGGKATTWTTLGGGFIHEWPPTMPRVRRQG
jgi:hypothetical protein